MKSILFPSPWLLFLVAFFCLVELSPPIHAQITSVPDPSQATTKFGNLAGSLQVFAGVLLLIGCVFAGIMFMTGKSQMAIMVFLGAAVVFGGAYIVGLIMGSLR